MKGRIVKRGNGWTVICDVGHVIDPTTGVRKRKQTWKSFPTRKEAQSQLAEIVRSVDRGEYADSKVTLGAWLATWLEEVVKSVRRASTYDGYKAIVTKHLTPALGHHRLQMLRPGHLETYYRGATLAGATLQVHHGILSSALRYAVRQGHVTRNVASLVDGKPRVKGNREEAQKHCWTAEEGRRFLEAAKQCGDQLAAFFALALDSGMRRGELCGLRWTDVDLDGGTVRVDRTLLRNKRGAEPVFGPTKTGAPRTINVGAETIRLLREHKRKQAELHMRNRTTYHDLGLVFAKEWGDLHGREDSLGLPLQANNIGGREMARVLKAAPGLRRIKFHGLRHTCATLLLGAGEPVHVVAARLGHRNPTVTLTIYAHALPGMQQQAARTLEALLHG
jgi:integrase